MDFGLTHFATASKGSLNTPAAMPASIAEPKDESLLSAVFRVIPKTSAVICRQSLPFVPPPIAAAAEQYSIPSLSSTAFESSSE